MLQQQMQGGIFQSTLPTRGSDPSGLNKRQISRNFNPRSPRGGATRSCSSTVGGIVGFQSTLPTRGSDPPPPAPPPRSKKFQSTLPTRGSDCIISADKAKELRISIHAPHEGERREAVEMSYREYKISIHAPHEGERLTRQSVSDWTSGFQSTLPTRGSDSAASRSASAE